MSKDNKKGKNLWWKILLNIIIVIVFLAAAAVFCFMAFYKPNVSSEVPFDTTPKDTEPGYIPTVEDGYKRKNGVYNFLVLGKDRVANLTDVFFVAQFNVKEHSMNIVQVPRDTYAYHGSNYAKINGLYSLNLVRNGYDEKKSVKDVVDFIQKNMNVKIDYYAMINLDAFVELVDLIGGVEINVPEDMVYYDPEQNLNINLKKGKQTINGAQAEQFVRFRSGYLLADVGRMDAQKIFMSSFVTQFKKSIKISMIDDLAKQFFDNVMTDMSITDSIYFAKELFNVDMSKLTFVSLPGGDRREFGDSGQWYFVLNRKSLLTAVNRYLNVYNTDITDSIFDASRVFTNQNSAPFNNIYTAPEQELVVRSGADVMDNGIEILRY